jgi:hypothetical protein
MPTVIVPVVTDATVNVLLAIAPTNVAVEFTPRIVFAVPFPPTPMPGLESD